MEIRFWNGALAHFKLSTHNSNGNERWAAMNGNYNTMQPKHEIFIDGRVFHHLMLKRTRYA